MSVIDVLRNRVDLHGAFSRLFNTEDGKIVMAHLVKTGFVLQSTFVAGDPQQTAMNEGTRRVVISIMKFVHRDHMQLIKQLETEIQNDNT